MIVTFLPCWIIFFLFEDYPQMSGYLLINNCLSFCLPPNIFILPSFVKKVFPCNGTLCWHNSCQRLRNVILLCPGFYSCCWDIRCQILYSSLEVNDFFWSGYLSDFFCVCFTALFTRLNLGGFLFIPLFWVCGGFHICSLQSQISSTETMAFTNELDSMSWFLSFFLTFSLSLCLRLKMFVSSSSSCL